MRGMILLLLLFVCSFRSSFALEVTDDSGERLFFLKPPQRIVSLAPSVTEILCAVGAEGQIVGITDFCPGQGKERVGGFLNPDLKKILSLKPDLVIAFGPLQYKVAEELKAKGVRVFLTYPRSLEEVLRSFEEIGELSGHCQRGRWLKEAVFMRLEELRRVLGDIPEGERPKIFRVMGIDPSKMGTLGGKSFQSGLYRAAGARNVFEDIPEDFFRVDLKEVERRDPDYLLVCLEREEDSNRVLQAMEEKGWRRLRAFREGRVLFFPCDLICRPGPRIAEAAFQIARALYPERVRLPQRIISLLPSVTEDLFLLGEGERLVGVSQYCSRVEGAKALPKVGTILQANEEAILKLQPDLIFVSSLMPQGMLKRAEGFGIRVERVEEPRNFAELCGKFLKIGALLGKELEALKILQKVYHSLPPDTPKPSRPKVLVQVGAMPLFVAGAKSLIGDAVKLAGGEMAFEGLSRPIDVEEVLRVDPAVIVIVPMGFDADKEKQRWKSFPKLRAVREGRVYVMDPHLLCSPSPLGFLEAVRQLKDIIGTAKE